MKKSTLIIVTLFLGILLFVSAFQQVNWAEIEAALFLFPKEALFLVFFINFLGIFIIGSYRWQVILHAQKCPVSYMKVLRAKAAGFTFSYVTPSALIAGEPVRAYMIKEESNCGWEKSSASVIIDQLIYLGSLFCVVIVGFVFLAEKFSLPRDVVYGFWTVFFLSLFIFYLFYKKTFLRSKGEHAFFTSIIYKTRLAKIGYIKSKIPAVESTEEIIEDFFRKNKLEFVIVLLLAFAEVFLNALAVMVTCFYLGHWLGVTRSIGVFSLWALANLVPIPGSLGSAELALSFVFDLFNAGKDTGLAFSLIFRAINIIYCLLGVLAFLHFTVKTASRKFSLEAPPLLLKIHKYFSGKEKQG